MNIKQLSWRNGSTCYVNVSAVTAMRTYDFELTQPLTEIYLTSGQSVIVQGNPEEVYNKLYGILDANQNS